MTNVQMFVRSWTNCCHVHWKLMQCLDNKQARRDDPEARREDKPAMCLPCQERSTGIWALLIGIDNHAIAPLRCAVADAEATSVYLTDRLSVP